MINLVSCTTRQGKNQMIQVRVCEPDLSTNLTPIKSGCKLSAKIMIFLSNCT